MPRVSFVICAQVTECAKARFWYHPFFKNHCLNSLVLRIRWCCKKFVYKLHSWALHCVV